MRGLCECVALCDPPVCARVSKQKCDISAKTLARMPHAHVSTKKELPTSGKGECLIKSITTPESTELTKQIRPRIATLFIRVERDNLRQKATTPAALFLKEFLFLFFVFCFSLKPRQGTRSWTH